MKDQHTKIKGYRDLSQAEIDLMNKIKAHAEQTEALVNEVGEHLHQQRAKSIDPGTFDGDDSEAERQRLDRAEPGRWLAMGRTDLQTAFMKIVRAVAQPTTF